MKIDAISLASELGLRVEVFSTIPSTLEYALEMVRKEKTLPDLIVSMHQTSGKGREGKSFYSPPNTGIYLTFVVAKEEFDQSYLTARCAVALRRSVREIFGMETGIKWVNDLYYDDRKVAGILVRATGDLLLISFGINVEMPDFVPDELKNRFGSLTVTCEKEKYQLLIATLYRELLVVRNISNEDLLCDYRDNCVHLDRIVRIFHNEKCIMGRCIGIGDDFSLLLETDDGVHSYSSGILDIHL